MHEVDDAHRSPITHSPMTRSGEPMESAALPLIEPIYQTSVYAFDDASQANATFAAGHPLYARDGLPNVRSLEKAVAHLEHAEDAIAVSSGMAAIATTFLTLLRAGDHVLLGKDGYCESWSLLEEMAAHFELGITTVDLNDLVTVEAALTPSTRLIFAETICNPGLRLVDLASLAAITQRRGLLLVVDNTFATPVFCQPLDLGADLVIHSAGKFLGGHSDVTAGIVAGSLSLVAKLKRTAYLYGPVLAPMEAWLTLCGISTLLPRVRWASQSAAEVACWLQQQSAVDAVSYAGLVGHDQAELARRLLPQGAGCVLSFRLVGGEVAANTVIEHLQTIPYVPSVGGSTTIVSFPPRTPCFDEADAPVLIPYGSATIRLSVGLEDTDDIIADLASALAHVVDPTVPSLRSAS